MTFMAVQKRMAKQGSMRVENVCPDLMEVFEITGFSDILDIRQPCRETADGIKEARA